MLAETDYLKIYDLIFTETHSEGFKIAEVRTLLEDPEYCFLDKPREGWLLSLKNYLDSKAMIFSDFNMNLEMLNFYESKQI